MSWFLGGIAFLILGYFTYGRLVERIVGPDDRKTPCVANPDGVDFVPLPQWKNMLIQLLNIAGCLHVHGRHVLHPLDLAGEGTGLGRGASLRRLPDGRRLDLACARGLCRLARAERKMNVAKLRQTEEIA